MPGSAIAQNCACAPASGRLQLVHKRSPELLLSLLLGAFALQKAERCRHLLF